MVEYKTPGEIDAMHAAGQVVARVLAAVRDQAVPGVRLAKLDATARDVLAEARATSPFLGYQPRFADTPFPAVICASVNDAALHDIPGHRRLKDGDLLTIDTGATLDGWTADAAISVQVGHPHQEDTRLIDTTARALKAGIAAAVPGGRLGDISAAIGARPATPPVTASLPTSAAAASATPCTRTRTSPMSAAPAAACAWFPAW